MLGELVERGYKTDKMKKNIEKANNVKREDFLNYKARTPNTKIPLIVTYNKNLPKMKQMVDNTWNTLKINPDEAVKFEEKTIICYRRNPNLKDLMGQTRISKGKVLRRKEKKVGKCSPCLSRIDTKCCKDIISTSKFKNRSGTKK